MLPVAMHLHGIGRAPTATLLHMRWVSMHLHRYRGGGGLACRIGFVSTSMSVWHAWYLQGGIDLFRLFVEIGRPFKKKKPLVLAAAIWHYDPLRPETEFPQTVFRLRGSGGVGKKGL